MHLVEIVSMNEMHHNVAQLLWTSPCLQSYLVWIMVLVVKGQGGRVTKLCANKTNSVQYQLGIRKNEILTLSSSAPRYLVSSCPYHILQCYIQLFLLSFLLMLEKKNIINNQSANYDEGLKLFLFGQKNLKKGLLSQVFEIGKNIFVTELC